MRSTKRLVIAWVFTALVPVFALAVFAQHASAATQRGAMVHLTDIDRARYGVAGVKIDRVVSRYARRHSRDMASAGHIFHSTDTHLREALGVRGWVIAGENVGVGTDVVALERAFMDSPPHRAALLSSNYHHAAVGIVRTTNRVWVTVIFWG